MAAKSGKITFSPLKTKKTFFCKNFYLFIEDNKNIFSNKHIIIFKNIITDIHFNL